MEASAGIVRLSADEAEELRLNLCDVLCWLSDFQAAHAGKEDQPTLPPSFSDLRDFNARLGGKLQRMNRGE